ncbi:hypothetical protein B0H10DRAFT_1968987 [Mycena sp. CBHHK59/15]|nr:hypothetical protein B0H10DRAFT_1968987 [Mycena sp. CBHHK59/15]
MAGAAGSQIPFIAHAGVGCACEAVQSDPFHSLLWHMGSLEINCFLSVKISPLLCNPSSGCGPCFGTYTCRVLMLWTGFPSHMQQEKDTEHGMSWDNRFTTEEDTTEPEESSYQYTADTFSSNLQAFVAFDLLMESQGYWAGSPENEINWGVTEENLTEPEEGLYQYTGTFSPNSQSSVTFDLPAERRLLATAAGKCSKLPFMSETNTATPTNNSNWSAFFPCSKHFIVSGGHFTGSVTNYLPNPVPSDFRMILLSDIYLQKEIQVAGNSGVVCRHYSVNSAKQMYSACIDGCSLAVAMYQGQHTEEDWQQDLKKLSGICHLNFVQIYSVVQSSVLHAVVFHDGSPFVLIVTYLDAFDYFELALKIKLMCLPWASMVLIPMHQLGPDPESIILSSVTLDKFHDFVQRSDRWERRSSSSSHIDTLVPLGSIVCWLADPEAPKETMCHMESKIEYMDSGWQSGQHPADPWPVVTEFGWGCIWLAQANYIFSALQIISNHEDYFVVLVDEIEYYIKFRDGPFCACLRPPVDAITLPAKDGHGSGSGYHRPTPYPYPPNPYPTRVRV